MAKETVRFEYDSDKLMAIRSFIPHAGITIEGSLEAMLDALFERYVSSEVREFIANNCCRNQTRKEG
ncbi:MAG: hypothetical protein IK020_10955 [Clostridiales bacterium]|nr:hypothetical protein [Clostridiales bacterium]